ncbi:APC family permease [Sinomonas terrae]|uniref:APC family permease n=1 Tax=Sinomonas terrae TaxID=2908838 RepID=A0ABS9U1E7_9MICC|nr:APC family permease [Sinomonas terrae]MCH6470155.1 APC family permease [Sinomonas terrae]
MTSEQGELARRLGTFDAVAIGLGSMMGAGIFAAFAPAAVSAGAGLVIGLAIAGVVAYCNATASAQLATQYPTSGGTYVYGRERLGEWPGFFAGWSFVIGKTASAAAMAITFAAYAAPAGWEKPVAVLAVLAVGAVNYVGVTRTANATKVLAAAVLVVLAFVVVLGLAQGHPQPSTLTTGLLDRGWYGILQAAALLFFAFAGYARIATMGEEVKEPQRTIPRAIIVALAIVLVVYAAVALTSLLTIGPDRLAASSAPLSDVVTAGGSVWASPIVRLGAAAATLGSLLSITAGIGRTTLAMARHQDLPGWLAAVHDRYHVPHRAEVVLAVVVCILVVTTDLRGALGFSSFGVLLYYFVANASAFTQDHGHRLYPKVLQILGAIGCVALAGCLPLPSIVAGLVVLAVGIVYRLIGQRVRREASGTARNPR